MKRPPSDQQLDASLVWRNRHAIESALTERFGSPVHATYRVTGAGAEVHVLEHGRCRPEIVPWSVLAPIINRAEGD